LAQHSRNMLRHNTQNPVWSPFTTSGQETEWIYSYNPKARMGFTFTMRQWLSFAHDDPLRPRSRQDWHQIPDK